MSTPRDRPGVRIPQPILTLSGHTDTIRTMAYLPCGQRLVTGASDKTIRVWRVGDGGQEGSAMMHATEVWRLVVTSDGKKIISNDRDGSVTIWDSESHQVVKAWKHKDKCPRVAISPDNQLLACGSRSVLIHEISSGRLKYEITTGKTVTSLSFSPDGNKLACGMSAVVAIYDVASRRCILKLNGHVDCVYDVVWSPDGSKLYSASKDQTIRCWSYETGDQVGDPWTGHTGCIYSLSLTPDGTKLASASNDRTVRLWDTTFGQSIGHPLQHSKGVWAVSISPANDIIASGGSNNKVSLWHVPWCNNAEVMPPFMPTHPRPVKPTLRKDNNRHSSLCHQPKAGVHSPTASSVVISPRNEKPLILKHELTASLLTEDFPQTVQSIDSNDGRPDRSLSRESTGGNGAESQTSNVITTSRRSQSPLVRRYHSADVPSPPRQILLSRAHSSPLPAPSSHKPKVDLGPFSAPTDLTPHIEKLHDWYVAGGAFADVYKCRYNSSSGAREVAVKAFRFNMAIKMCRRELGIWKRLQRPNIVPFLGTTTGFGSPGSMSMVSLWMSNDTLQTFLQLHNDRLTIGHRLQILLDVANGLDYLHCCPVVHGDLSGNNVLLDENFTARLADFGLSSVIETPQGLTYLAECTAKPGAVRWSAPEQFEDTYEKTPKSDIYSFGCISLQALSGQIPWSELPKEPAIVRHKAQGRHPGRPASRAIEDAHWEFIQTCWTPVDERPETNELISSLEEFLSLCPQFPVLRDVLPFSSSSTSP